LLMDFLFETQTRFGTCPVAPPALVFVNIVTFHVARCAVDIITAGGIIPHNSAK
jgi:hypothetical protein